MEWTVRVRHEEGSYWAEVSQLPGCFASGDTFDELVEALKEAIHAYLSHESDDATSVPDVEVAEITVATSQPEPQAA